MIHGYENDPLIQHLRAFELEGESDFWSFKNASRSGAHALLQYPAMMVPNLQGLILKSIKETNPAFSNVLDPFVGSGTMLVEAMEQGLNFHGIDINPLAGLACLAKSGPYFTETFREKKDLLVNNIASDNSTYTPTPFNGLEKWFSDDVAKSLSKIQHHIRREKSKWARRLFWLALCRAIRLTCNSRTSTYKLHIKSDLSQKSNPTLIFANTLSEFNNYLIEQHATLLELNLIKKGRYIGDIKVEIANNNQAISGAKKTPKFDIVMTSPPYGDNTTTIPYGQYAYLPLNWIDLEDINPNIDHSLKANTHAIDSASLGGSLKQSAMKQEDLVDRYKPAKDFISSLGDNKKGAQRFSTFFWDFEQSIKKISAATNKGGYQTWTIANRRIGGLTVPMEDLLKAMLETQGLDIIGKIDRQILKKKMPSRNNLTDTMTSESILIAKMA